MVWFPLLSITSGLLMFRLIRFYSQPSLAKALQNSDVALLYGSQKGASQQAALRLDRELKWRLKLNTVVAQCDDFSFDSLKDIPANKLLLFFMTSHGTGGPTDNAEKFWDGLMSSSTKLDNINYSVLGRGSSAYTNTFNEAGIRTDEKLASLGAHRFAPYAQTDKLAIDNEEPYFNWKESVIRNLIAKFNLIEEPLVYQPAADIVESPAAAADWKPEPKEFLSSLAASSPSRSFPEFANITKHTSKDDFGREFVSATFDLSNTSQSYESGDYLVVWPSNSQQEVEIFLKAFGLDKDQVVTVDKTRTYTYEQLARNFIEINGRLTRELLRYFIPFAPSSQAKGYIQKICDSHELFTDFSKTHFNIGRALLEFSQGKPWPELPRTMLLDLLPQMQPRDYSISSSPLTDAAKVSVGLVVESQDQWRGVATNYLLNVPDGTLVPVCVEMSDFKLPSDPSLPVVMIGIGTGVSPYRGFVEERHELAKQGIPVGPTLLFGGFRSEASFQFQNYFKGVDNLEIYTAYSRTGQGQYVQHILEQHGEKIYDLINQGAYFYICGSARLMKRHVRDAIIDIIAQNQGINTEAAALQFKVLKREKRLRTDLW